MPVAAALETDVIVDAVRQATESVFLTMLALEVHVQPHQAIAQPEPLNGVVALVGFTGPWSGTGTLYCQEGFACKIGSAMLLTEIAEVNGDVLDGVGEVANMVMGNFKQSIESHTGPLGLSVPTIVYGKNFSTRSATKSDWLVVPFKAGDDVFEIRVWIKPK